MRSYLLISFLLHSLCIFGLKAQIDESLFNEVESKVIEWRHHIHQNPELSNREFKTSEYVAKHLKSLGIEIQTGVAHTGI